MLRLFFVLTLVLVSLPYGSDVQAADEKKSFWAPTVDVNVIDGDTLVVNNRIIRLSGIDAPEIGQQCDHNGHLWSCGMTAALDLQKSLTMARLSALHCWVNSKNAVWESATCYVGEKDLAAASLGAGTVEPAKDASPHYLSMAASAKEGDLGIWGSTFQSPSKWAEKKRLSPDRTHCAIKAITTTSGKKFFASPLMKAYAKIKTTRRFCSDEDALLEDYHPLLRLSDLE